MKKKLIIILSIISFILTLIIGCILSLLKFNIFNDLYLLLIFSIFEYISLVLYYGFSKIKNKEKIKLKKIFGLGLIFLFLLLFLLCVIVLDIDYLNWYMYSSPFYLNIIVRCVEFGLPGIISLIIGIILLKKEWFYEESIYSFY